MENEIWKSIEGLGHNYEVSSRGRVRRITFHNGKVRKPYTEPRILRPKVTKGGYLRVCLRTVGQASHRYVSALVAEAFIGPRPQGMQVAHLDGDVTNNTLENLAYKTPKDNTADKYTHGTILRGEANRASKLTDDNVREILDLRAAGMSLPCIARKFSVSAQAVHRITRGEGWLHIT